MAIMKRALPLLFLFSSVAVNFAADDGDDGGDDDDEATPIPWVAKGGFILLIVAVLQMFYALAVVVEEYFVPALNTMCVKYQIPDDVAGATFMAAGASAPEMFASFIALFVTHSTLGVGTILGSELFNHLIITAGSILYSKSGTIQTEPRFVGREAFFYALALGTLIFCLSSDSSESTCYNQLSKDQQDTVDDDDGGYICVVWWKSLLLIFGYILYALVCGFYQKLIPMFCPIKSSLSNEEDWKNKSGLVGDDEGVNIRSSQSMYMQPSDNFKDKSDLETSKARNSAINENPNANPLANERKGVAFDVASGDEDGSTTNNNRGSLFERSRAQTTAMTEAMTSAGETMIKNMAPAYVVEGATADLYTVELDPEGNSFGCYLWKQSKFYSKIPYNAKAWQLRWIQVDKDGFRSMRSRNVTKGMRSFNIYEATDIEVLDPERFILKVHIPSGDLFFQAPSEKILIGVQNALSKYQGIFSNMPKDQKKKLRRESMKVASGSMDVSTDAPPQAAEIHDDDNDQEDHESLMDWPETNVGIFFHIALLPIKASLYYTIPDVRLPGNEGKFCMGMFMSVVYLAVFSFIMTECMELLGPVFGISDFIMGVVFAAAGTSFPNVFASMVVARQGMGNAAISNALGGNVFNIFIGLGLPWFTYSFLGTDYVDTTEHVYTGLTAGGIIFPTLLLLILLVGFILVLICTGWKLYTSHAYIALVMYVGFLIWVFETSMLKPNLG